MPIIHFQSNRLTAKRYDNQIKKKNIVFRNPSITALDAKMVPLDHVLTNLFQLIAANGATIKLRENQG